MAFLKKKSLSFLAVLGGTMAIAACAVSLPATANTPASRGVPTPVAAVDLNRYMGKWYEIGRLPMFFQRKCASDVTATYTLKSTGSVKVNNQCIAKNGKPMQSIGEATQNGASGSQLKVTFLPQSLRWLPVGKADYWVLALDANYQYALVGTPDKKYLWMLSRTPKMSDEVYQQLSQTAQAQGYDLTAFQRTIHTAQH